MNSGGTVDTKVRVVVRFIGVLAPPALTLYGYMVTLGYAPADRFRDIVFFFTLGTVWTLYGIMQYLLPQLWKHQATLTLVLYHIFGALFLLFVSGFSTFALAAWAILALASYIYYAASGYAISIAILLFTVAIDMMLHPNAMYDSGVALLNIIGVIFISGSAAAFVFAYKAGAAQVAVPPASDDHQRLLTIMNNLTDAVFVVNPAGKIELYNAASLSLLDTNSDIRNKNIDVVLKTRLGDGATASIHELLVKSKHVEVNDSLYAGDPEDPTRLELTYAPIRGTFKDTSYRHGSEGYIIIARDVTKIKSLEEERDEFISVVSHELRTPVTVAEGSISNAQLLVERGKDTKKNLTDALKEAHEQVLFLAGMVNDLSTLSRAERGVAAENEAIDITSFAHDLYNEYLPQAQKQKLHFNLELEPKLGSLMTSRLYLHELLQNLITNAIKYTRKGSVTLHIKKSDSMVEFTVIDTGIGISKADQAKIFNKFYRSEDFRTRETSGTGLGLYVAAKLAKKLKSSISVKSRLNHGSSFSIQLPSHEE